jgi:hypothetical protein
MPGRLNVLVVGSMELTNVVRDALVLCGRSRLAVATNYWELCSISLREAEHFHVAILDLSFSNRELQRRAECIRQGWADAAILLVSDNCELLEDSLYDKRIPAEIKPEELVAVIERLVGHNRRARRVSCASGINADGRRHDLQSEDGEQGSGLVPPACSCAADLLHAGTIVTDMPKVQP